MTHKTSLSPLKGTEYLIPQGNEDCKLNDFIDANKHKKIVAVQGLGFVGTVMSLVVANSMQNEYAVIGIDQASPESYWKIAEINRGILPIISSDPLVSEYFEETKIKKNLFATHDTGAFLHADVIIIDINLDVTKIRGENENLESYDVPMNGFKKAIKSIGESCKPNALILVETTVPPGTCREIVYPIISDCLKLRGLDSNLFSLGHSYERVMPGPNYINSIKNFYRVYSGIDDKSANAVEYYLKTIISTDEYPLTRLKTTESTEIAKVLENSYRAMNISFVIEWSRFAEEAGVDLYEVVDAIRLRPTHANLMYPGIGVGGYCLTKDPLLASWASKEFYGISSGLESSVRAVENNDKMPRYCFEFVKNVLTYYDKEIRKIGLLGVAYGPGIGDTRFSPVEDFYNRLSKLVDDIECQDPYVNYWTELNLNIQTSLPVFFENKFDALIVTTAHKEYIELDNLYKLIFEKEITPLIIDTVGLLNIKKLPSSYIQNKNFFVLGVGHNVD